MRTMDEKVTIEVMTRYRLADGFCSSNSGMQASRALERLKSPVPLNHDIMQSVQVNWGEENKRLFVDILDAINNLDSDDAELTTRYLIYMARKRAAARRVSDEELVRIDSEADPLNFVMSEGDPEAVKCLVAACLEILYAGVAIVVGVTQQKTAADARSKAPGDLAVTIDEKPQLTVEVKAPDVPMSWKLLDAGERILQSHKTARCHFIVLGSTRGASGSDVSAILNRPEAHVATRGRIHVIGLGELYALADVSDDRRNAIRKAFALNLSHAPSVRSGTRDAWLKTARRFSTPK